MDRNKRLALQRQLGQWMIDNYYATGIASMSAVYGANQRVGDWPLTPASPFPGYYEYLTHGSKP
ncbi:MAG: hypothetical protein HYX83_02595 [Chloroflexi bacterium]|nr:hypothetical protein [Chloroflexota bacterium]